MRSNLLSHFKRCFSTAIAILISTSLTLSGMPANALLNRNRVEQEAARNISATLKGGQGLFIDSTFIDQHDLDDILITHSESSKGGGLLSAKRTTIDHVETRKVVRSLFDGGEGGVIIVTREGGRLQAPIVKGKKALELITRNPDAKFVVEVSHDTTFESHQKSGKSLVWQSQSVGGAHHILVLRERKTMFTFSAPLESKKSCGTANKIIDLMNKIPAPARKTLTLDNGGEFAKHEKLAQTLGLPSYFCDPYASWQKGGVEKYKRAP